MVISKKGVSHIAFSLALLCGFVFIANASDKYPDRPSAGRSSGYTSCGSGCSQGYTSTGQRQTIRSGDYNGDGDYNDPNEVTVSTDRDSGGSDSRGSSPSCTGIDIAVTGLRFEVPGTQTQTPGNTPSSRFNVSSNQSRSGVYSAVGSQSVSTEVVVGANYVPVATIQNIGCNPTNYTSSAGTGALSWVRNRNQTQYFRNQLPFGSNGGFPVRLTIDFGTDSSVEVTAYANNQGPLNRGQAITVRFPQVTIPNGGSHRATVIADPTAAQAPGNTCTADATGDWGCVRESDRGTNNQRQMTLRATTPSLALGSFIINPGARTLFGSSGAIVDASTADERDISTLTSQQEVGLYWVGQSVNFSSCTGSISSSSGANLTGFSGQRDTAGLSIFTLLGLPTNANQVDANIPEPGDNQRHTFTISCRSTGGTLLTDSLALVRGTVPPDPVIPPPVACSDSTDNDGDGLVDASDPGCWDNPLDPATYNPSNPGETNLSSVPPTVTATPAIVRRGESVTVRWNANGNTGCQLTGGSLNQAVAPNESSSASVAVDALTTFQLVCNGTSAEAVVQILPTLYES